MAVAALGFGLWPDAAPAQTLNYGRACVQELERGDPFQGILETDRQGQLGVARGCAGVATSDRTGGVRVARARFYAGRAYRIAGDTTEAIRNLENAVSAGPDFNGFARELRAARLELIQAYRMAGRLEEAEARLGGLTRDDPAVALQRAMITLTRLGHAGKEAAFNDLRAWFTREDALLLNNTLFPLTHAEIRRGRAWLFRLGLELGQGALRNSTGDEAQRIIDAQRAIDFFGPVADTIRAACPDVHAPCPASGIDGTERLSAGVDATQAPSERDLELAFYELGAARLRAAGLRDSNLIAVAGDPGALDCMSGGALPQSRAQIDQAKNDFRAIERRYPAFRAHAQWGLGCAILADLPRARDAIERNAWLEEAIGYLAAGADNSAENLVMLARARGMQNNYEDARRYYLAAAAALTNDGSPELRRRKAALRSQIYLEVARTHLAAGADASGLEEAIRNLQRAATESEANGEARLALGAIYLQRGDYDSARVHLEAAEQLGDGDAGKAEARYLLSRRLTVIEQARLAPVSRVGRAVGGDRAVDFATRAFQSNQTNLAYRRQACLARIVFGFTADQHYCAADRVRDGEGYGEALLYEGMFFLKRGAVLSGGARLDNWAVARRVFQTGLQNVRPGMRLDGIEVRDLLHYGERYVLLCAGLGHGDTETANDTVRQFFRRSGMPNCNNPGR